MTDITFADATPVAMNVPGRPAAPNPYTDAVKSIVGKTAKLNGDDVPAAKAFPWEHPTVDTDEYKKAVQKLKGQFSDAGDKCQPAVTVRSAITPIKDAKGKVDPKKSTVTFWTIDKIVRARKPKTDAPVNVLDATGTASTEQSTAVTSA
jgi:hypothetical protein